MKFTRKYVVICIAGGIGHSFFNSEAHAKEHKKILENKYPYYVFKIFKELEK